MSDDGLYAKKVARRMLQMTRHINQDWKAHVGSTGVTCYTCHRGQPVPSFVWYDNPGAPRALGFAATNDGLGHPNKINGTTAMQIDPLTATLENKELIRIQATSAYPAAYGGSIQATEQTYSLMIHISESLGVNCTFCHEISSVRELVGEHASARHGLAWHPDGARSQYQLSGSFEGDVPCRVDSGQRATVPKVSCATCHQGVNKPLYGVSMAKDYPELGGVSSP